ncbi:cytochrome c biogenesis heme-transporting ATPase CcmA [Gallaecimonas kandeliae]|uniref:cytochrome c biogenesis heme-transporting ATPase CcmA n=1 Tax=Gallaecimonas kandeliae TaxID=3029055 RepID=UPI00264722A5|nr:cytochrome c biogenesis heme-transporting ATPase CcmA [Gallaecimonas kandeliae]WKE66768.1 cytochrome c biogenesis heme-transporting ATPase CcmA [Gallaecimonas kandeliae]
MTYPLLAADNLCCIREERCLFEGLSFSLEPGQLVQLEGRNGAGKSSLLALLAGLARPDAGQVYYLGQPIEAVRQAYHQDLLFIGHQGGINPVLSPLENLAFYAKVLPAHPVDPWELLDRVGLFGFEEQPVGQLSAGQQRRVALARLWQSKARLWLLDEPMTAVDKKGVQALEAQLEAHCQGGGAVIFTTHQPLGLSLSHCLKLEAA